MQQAEVKQIVAEVLAEQKRLHNNEADEVVLRTIATILTSFGIEQQDRVELRADFQHLRRWRKATEQIERLGWKAAATVIAGAMLAILSGVAGLIWLGVQTKFGK